MGRHVAAQPRTLNVGGGRRHSGMLIHTLVVALVLGVMSAAAIRGLGQLKVQAQRVACEADVQATSSAAELYRVRHNRYPEAVNNLRSEGYITITATTDHVLDYQPSVDGRTYSLTGMLQGGGVCAASTGGI